VSACSFAVVFFLHRRDRFWRKLSYWILVLVPWKKTWMRLRPVKRRMMKKRR